MKKKGVASYGYDTSSLAVSVCNNKSLKASHNLDDLPNQFDLISFWHSLEHVSDYTKALKKTKQILSKNGSVVVQNFTQNFGQPTTRLDTGFILLKKVSLRLLNN